MVAAAVIGGAVIGAGASIYASDQASDAQSAAAGQASDVQRGIYDQTRSDLMPYNLAGQDATARLREMTSGDPTKIQAMLQSLPGYQFALSQGLKTVQNQYGARGLGLSGAAQKGAAMFATGLAEQTFGDQWNRLMGLATLGENAAAQTGAYGTQTAANIGNNLIGAANAQAAASIAQGQAVGNAANTISNMYVTNSLLQQQGYTGFWGQGAPAQGSP